MIRLSCRPYIKLSKFQQLLSFRVLVLKVFDNILLSFRDYFETRWKKYLENKDVIDGTTHSKPDTQNAAERDKFYNSLSYSGWGGSSGHDAPMIA